MDYQIFAGINNLAGKNQVLDFLAVFFGVYLLYIFLGLAVILWLKSRFRNKIYLFIFSAIISRVVIVEVIKRWVNRPRPYEMLSVHQIFPDVEKGLSFPSGHTVIYFAFAFSFYGTKWFWPLVILATLGSISRVFIGVHYPSDIFVGCLAAAITVWGLRQIFKKQFAQK